MRTDRIAAVSRGAEKAATTRWNSRFMVIRLDFETDRVHVSYKGDRVPGRRARVARKRHSGHEQTQKACQDLRPAPPPLSSRLPHQFVLKSPASGRVSASGTVSVARYSDDTGDQRRCLHTSESLKFARATLDCPRTTKKMPFHRPSSSPTSTLQTPRAGSFTSSSPFFAPDTTTKCG